MNKKTSFAHFTSLSKWPITSIKNFKYPTSIPSPKNSSRKFSNNIQSPTKEDELTLIKKKFLKNIKHLKSTSSYLSFISQNNKFSLNKKNKLSQSFKNQLLLSSMDNSSIVYSKEKIFSYLNNSYKNNSMNKSLNNKSISNLKKKKDNNHTQSNNNLISKSLNQKKFTFMAISYRKNSVEKNKNIQKFNLNQKKNSISFCDKTMNKKNNFINTSNDNLNNKNIPNMKFYNNYYNHKIKINSLQNYLGLLKNQKKNNLSNKSVSINNISSSQNKNKKYFSSTTKISPRTSLYNINSISSRTKKKKNTIISLKDYKNNNNNYMNNNNYNKVNYSMNIHENLISNNNLFYNGIKNNNSKGKILNKFNQKQNINDCFNNLNIKYNKNNINQIQNKISKLLSQSQREILIKKLNKDLTTNKFQNEENIKNEKNIEKTKIEKKEKELEKKKLLKKEKKSISLKNIKEKKEIKEIKEKIIKEDSEKKKCNRSISTLSTSNHDNNYYQKQSKDLSLYISSYKKKYNEYPETSLSFYKYGRLIGQGAFGKVNLGLNVLTGRIVAIKSFDKIKLNNTENKNKIFYETDLMKKLNHPNITKILECFESEKYYLIIMEYINGGNLFSFVKKRRKLSEKTAKFLFRQIILGIKYIHSQNIVHRDIKLENILIDVNNNIKICDFGIGKILDNNNNKLYDQCGTPMYMAPEILLSNKDKGYYPFPVDLWSSGIALYIMLSGTLPFSLNNNKDKKNYLQYCIVHNQPKNIDHISDDAKNLLNGLLEKNPKKRFNCDDCLNHPWLKLDNNNNYKYHLFTKAEMIMLSKTFIDYRYAKIDDLKENFSLSNLEIEKNVNNENINIKTKSYILAPYNTMKNFFPNDNESEEDDFNTNNNINIKLENGIIVFSNKVREFNINYELNNNDELDNGMLINTKTESFSNSFRNNSLSNINDNLYYEDDYLNNSFKNNNHKDKNEDKSEMILNKIEYFGYDKDYVLDCLKNKKICHATAIYYLMMKYENF